MAKLQQKTTVQAYYAEFETLANQITGIPPEFCRSCFESGLRRDIYREIYSDSSIPSNRQEEHINAYTDATYKQAQVKFAEDYASCSRSMNHALQEFESVLMEPVNNEAPTSTSGVPEDCKPKVLAKQLSSPGNQESQANIAATL